MKIALAIITMAFGLLFAFSESPTMIPNVLGVIAYIFAGICFGDYIYSRRRKNENSNNK